MHSWKPDRLKSSERETSGLKVGLKIVYRENPAWRELLILWSWFTEFLTTLEPYKSYIFIEAQFL